VNKEIQTDNIPTRVKTQCYEIREPETVKGD